MKKVKTKSNRIGNMFSSLLGIQEKSMTTEVLSQEEWMESTISPFTLQVGVGPASDDLSVPEKNYYFDDPSNRSPFVACTTVLFSASPNLVSFELNQSVQTGSPTGKPVEAFLLDESGSIVTGAQIILNSNGAIAKFEQTSNETIGGKLFSLYVKYLPSDKGYALSGFGSATFQEESNVTRVARNVNFSVGYNVPLLATNKVGPIGEANRDIYVLNEGSDTFQYDLYLHVRKDIDLDSGFQNLSATIPIDNHQLPNNQHKIVTEYKIVDNYGAVVPDTVASIDCSPSNKMYLEVDLREPFNQHVDKTYIVQMICRLGSKAVNSGLVTQFSANVGGISRTGFGRWSISYPANIYAKSGMTYEKTVGSKDREFEDRSDTNVEHTLLSNDLEFDWHINIDFDNVYALGNATIVDYIDPALEIVSSQLFNRSNGLLVKKSVGSPVVSVEGNAVTLKYNNELGNMVEEYVLVIRTKLKNPSNAETIKNTAFGSYRDTVTLVDYRSYSEPAFVNPAVKDVLFTSVTNTAIEQGFIDDDVVNWQIKAKFAQELPDLVSVELNDTLNPLLELANGKDDIDIIGLNREDYTVDVNTQLITVVFKPRGQSFRYLSDLEIDLNIPTKIRDGIKQDEIDSHLPITNTIEIKAVGQDGETSHFVETSNPIIQPLFDRKMHQDTHLSDSQKPIITPIIGVSTPICPEIVLKSIESGFEENDVVNWNANTKFGSDAWNYVSVELNDTLNPILELANSKEDITVLGVNADDYRIDVNEQNVCIAFNTRNDSFDYLADVQIDVMIPTVIKEGVSHAEIEASAPLTNSISLKIVDLDGQTRFAEAIADPVLMPNLDDKTVLVTPIIPGITTLHTEFDKTVHENVLEKDVYEHSHSSENDSVTVLEDQDDTSTILPDNLVDDHAKVQPTITTSAVTNELGEHGVVNWVINTKFGAHTNNYKSVEIVDNINPVLELANNIEDISINGVRDEDYTVDINEQCVVISLNERSQTFDYLANVEIDVIVPTKLKDGITQADIEKNMPVTNSAEMKTVDRDGDNFRVSDISSPIILSSIDESNLLNTIIDQEGDDNKSNGPIILPPFDMPSLKNTHEKQAEQENGFLDNEIVYWNVNTKFGPDATQWTSVVLKDTLNPIVELANSKDDISITVLDANDYNIVVDNQVITITLNERDESFEYLAGLEIDVNIPTKVKESVTQEELDINMPITNTAEVITTQKDGIVGGDSDTAEPVLPPVLDNMSDHINTDVLEDKDKAVVDYGIINWTVNTRFEKDAHNWVSAEIVDSLNPILELAHGIDDIKVKGVDAQDYRIELKGQDIIINFMPKDDSFNYLADLEIEVEIPTKVKEGTSQLDIDAHSPITNTAEVFTYDKNDETNTTTATTLPTVDDNSSIKIDNDELFEDSEDSIEDNDNSVEDNIFSDYGIVNLEINTKFDHDAANWSSVEMIDTLNPVLALVNSKEDITITGLDKQDYTIDVNGQVITIKFIDWNGSFAYLADLEITVVIPTKLKDGITQDEIDAATQQTDIVELYTTDINDVDDIDVPTGDSQNVAPLDDSIDYGIFDLNVNTKFDSNANKWSSVQLCDTLNPVLELAHSKEDITLIGVDPQYYTIDINGQDIVISFIEIDNSFEYLSDLDIEVIIPTKVKEGVTQSDIDANSHFTIRSEVKTVDKQIGSDNDDSPDVLPLINNQDDKTLESKEYQLPSVVASLLEDRFVNRDTVASNEVLAPVGIKQDVVPTPINDPIVPGKQQSVEFSSTADIDCLSSFSDIITWTTKLKYDADIVDWTYMSITDKLNPILELVGNTTIKGVDPLNVDIDDTGTVVNFKPVNGSFDYLIGVDITVIVLTKIKPDATVHELEVSMKDGDITNVIELRYGNEEDSFKKTRKTQGVKLLPHL